MPSSTFTLEGISAYYAFRVPKLHQANSVEWCGPCPIHDGKDNNFKVKPNTGVWFCHSDCGKGGNILKLEQELSGADFPTCRAAAFQIIADVLAGTAASQPAKTDFPFHQRTEVERYAYEDIDGKVVFEAVRYLKPDGSKGFRQCRPDGQGGLIWNLGDIERVPYHLPKLIKAETVYLAEGEKDVHTLEKWGLVASCNSGGTGGSHLYIGWAKKFFEGCRVVILPDNDDPGRKHAVAVAGALHAFAASIRIVELPGLPPKGDVTVWRDAGGTLEDFCKLTEAAPPLNLATLLAFRKSWEQASQKAHQKGPVRRLVLRRISEIVATLVSWLWPGRIARGKVTIIAGNPGSGKSQLSVEIAAIVTTGGVFPVDQQQCEAGNVVFMNGEDNPADTIRPRLEAAGADLERVHFVDGVTVGSGNNDSKPFSLETDLPALDQTLDELGNVAAVIIDPITAYLGGVDSHKNAEIRAVFTQLGELAARHSTAIIAVSHLTKAPGPQVLMRVMGSLAFVAAARAVYLVAIDPKDQARRLFLPMKNNIGRDDKGFAFHIESATVQSPAGPLPTSRLIWESEFASETADEVMQSGMAPQSTSALAVATEWLQAALADGPVGGCETV